MTTLGADELQPTEEELSEFEKCPFVGEERHSRQEIGKKLLERQEKLNIQEMINQKKRLEEENQLYERDRDLIYVSGFERYLPQEIVKQFVEKYGTVTHFEYFDGRKPEKGQRV